MKILEEYCSKKAIGAILVAMILYIVLLVGSFIYGGNKQEVIMNIIISIFDSTIGWLLGVAASPYYPNEEGAIQIVAIPPLHS